MLPAEHMVGAGELDARRLHSIHGDLRGRAVWLEAYCDEESDGIATWLQGFESCKRSATLPLQHYLSIYLASGGGAHVRTSQAV